MGSMEHHLFLAALKWIPTFRENLVSTVTGNAHPSNPKILLLGFLGSAGRKPLRNLYGATIDTSLVTTCQLMRLILLTTLLACTQILAIPLVTTLTLHKISSNVPCPRDSKSISSWYVQNEHHMGGWAAAHLGRRPIPSAGHCFPLPSLPWQN